MGTAAAAEDCSRAPSSWGNTSAYESWCRACGGTISGSGPRIQCNQGPNWGGSHGGASGATSAAYGGLYGASYQLGYALGQWLFGGGSDPQADLQRRLMMEELERRQVEAERQHREEEARRLAAIHDRLATTLKLSGSPNLQLKGTAGGSQGLKLKLGDSAEGQAGIKGLPGIYLNDGRVPYGIPGLPGIYTGGPGAPKPADAAPVSSPDPAGGSPALDPASMTPQQLADVAELVSKLPPEEQQRLLDAAQSDAASRQPAQGIAGLPSAQVVTPLERQAAASQAAVAATVPEDASKKARAGFDEPLGAATGSSGTTVTATSASGPAPGKAVAAASQPKEDLIAKFLFPGSRPPGPFPVNPDPPPTNPLREERRLQAELSAWDDWAVRSAARVLGPPDDTLYPEATEKAILDAGVVKEYAPDLLARYESDRPFRQSVDQKLLYAAAFAAPGYYQGLADAHKASIRTFQAELEKLAAAGKLDRLVPLEEQYRLHPERRQIVEAIRVRIAAEEKAALEKAAAEGSGRLDNTYRQVFRMIRDEAAQNR